MFSFDITARILRINVESYEISPCIRLELLGCLFHLGESANLIQFSSVWFYSHLHHGLTHKMGVPCHHKISEVKNAKKNQ